MLLNYLKLSLRLLVRNPFFTLINLLCLSVGFSVFIILWQYSQNELKSDQFQKDYNSIYKICYVYSWTDNQINWEQSVTAIGHPDFHTTLAKYANLIDYTNIYGQQNFQEYYLQDHGKEIFMSYIDREGNQKAFLESKVIYAESSFLNFFSIPLLKGNGEKALELSNSVVISENIAMKYFGSSDPLNKIILLNNTIPLRVTGVFQNLPRNTHLDFEIAISYERIRKRLEKIKARTEVDAQNDFMFPYSYVKLSPETDIPALERKLTTVAKDEVQRLWCGDCPFGKARVIIQPFTEIAFQNLRAQSHIPKSRTILRFLGVASIVVLFMAWISYINLTISFNNRRFKEVAAKKTVGARSRDFILQFVVEAIVINALSFFLAITFIQLFSIPAESFLNFYKLKWTEISSSTYLTVGLVLLIGILMTGLYPAIITLKNSPKSLFGTLRSKSPGNKINWILTTLQFTSAVVLIIWIFAAQLQLNFMLSKNIGLNKENVLNIDLPITPTPNFKFDIDNLAHEISALPTVRGLTLCNSINAITSHDGNAQIDLGRTRANPHIGVDTNGGIDENFIPFFGVKMLAGRNFRADSPSDKDGVLISRESMARLSIEKPEGAVGMRIYQGQKEVEIIGVFEDYRLRPFLIGGYSNFGGMPGIALTYKDYLTARLPRTVSVKIDPHDFEKTVESIQKVYASVFPGSLFNWYLLNEQFNNQYQSDAIVRNQIVFFTTLAIGIACLGLLGMISNKVIEKTKEIGIRKVMGAKIYQVASILSKTTIKQIALATIFGIPLANFLVKQYLERFSERITLQWWNYALPIAILVVIMLVSIASVLWKAVSSNPVEALKYE